MTASVPCGLMRAWPGGWRRAERGTVSAPIPSAHAPSAHKVAGRPAPPLQFPHHAPRRRPASSGRPLRRRCALGGGRHSVAAALRAPHHCPQGMPARAVSVRCPGRSRVRASRVLVARFPACNAVPAPVRATGPPVAPMSRPAGRCAGPAARAIVTPGGGSPCHRPACGCAGSMIVRGAGSSGAAALEPRRRQPATPPENRRSADRARSDSAAWSGPWPPASLGRLAHRA